MTHSQKLAAARDAVVEAMRKWHEIDATFPGGDLVALTEHADVMRDEMSALLALESRTCPECKGIGYTYDPHAGETLCPAGCHEGEKK